MPSLGSMAVVALSLTIANAEEKNFACIEEGSLQAQTLIWLVRQENSGGCLAGMGPPIRGPRAPWQLRSAIRLGRRDSTAQVSFTISDGSRYFRDRRQVHFTMPDGSVYAATGNQAYAHSADGSYHYYRIGKQVTESLQGGNGFYRYYEDGHTVTLDDTRHGRDIHFRKRTPGDCGEAP